MTSLVLTFQKVLILRIPKFLWKIDIYYPKPSKFYSIEFEGSSIDLMVAFLEYILCLDKWKLFFSWVDFYVNIVIFF